LLERDPANSAARSEMARLLLVEGRIPDLQAFLDESAAVLPGDPVWPRWKAQLAMLQNKPEDALQFLAQAFDLQRDPQSLAELADALIQNKQHAAALKVLEDQQALVTGQPVLEALRGQAFYAQGDAAQAKQAFARALDLSVEVPQIGVVGQRLVAAVGLDQGVAELSAVAASGPRADNIQVVLAQLELRNGRAEAAAERAARLVAGLTPDSPLRNPAQHLWSAALSTAGRFREAVEVLLNLVKESPADAEAYNNLAFMLADNLDRAPEALPYAQKAVQLRPRDPSILDTLGWVQYRSGQLNESAATLEQSLAVSPTGYGAYHLALVLKDLDRPSAARERLQMAKSLAEQANDTDLLKKVQEQLQLLDGSVQR